MRDILKSSWFQQVLQCFIFAIILVGGDFLFFYLKFEDRFPRHGIAILETFGLVLLISFAFRRRGFYLSIMSLMLLAFVQMSHLSYYGTFVHPTKIYQFFTNFFEVMETAKQDPGLLFGVSFWILLISLVCTWGLSKIFIRQNRTWRPMPWVLLVALCYIPVRTFAIKDDYGKQPAVHNLAFSNMYSSTSYFFARTLPFKWNHSRQIEESARAPLKKTSEKPQVNVIFILGESLRYQNMQLFGYEKPTTPQLVKLSEQMPMVYRRAVSGGVCTDVAVPMFMNNAYGTNPTPAILEQDRCLFRLAKNNGFETSFYSAQTEGELKHIINFLCAGSIDHMRLALTSSEDVTEGKKSYDEVLLPDLEKVDFSKPQFLVLHQRGSHVPYSLRYPPEKTVFPVDPQADMTTRLVTEYNNSVAFTDEILSEIIQRIFSQSKMPTYIVFTSDHGQVLGENKSWGHSDLNEYVFKVPFLFLSSSKDNIYKQVNAMPEFVVHEDLSSLLIYLLGYGDFPKFTNERKVFVMGSDLDGLDGGMWVKINAQGIESVQKDALNPL